MAFNRSSRGLQFLQRNSDYVDLGIFEWEESDFGLFRYRVGDDNSCRAYPEGFDFAPSDITARAGSLLAFGFGLLALLILFTEFCFCRFYSSRTLALTLLTLASIAQMCTLLLFVTDVCTVEPGFELGQVYVCQFRVGGIVTFITSAFFMMGAISSCGTPKVRPAIYNMRIKSRKQKKDPCIFTCCVKKSDEDEDDEDEEFETPNQSKHQSNVGGEDFIDPENPVISDQPETVDPELWTSVAATAGASNQVNDSAMKPDPMKPRAPARVSMTSVYQSARSQRLLSGQFVDPNEEMGIREIEVEEKITKSFDDEISVMSKKSYKHPEFDGTDMFFDAEDSNSEASTAW